LTPAYLPGIFGTYLREGASIAIQVDRPIPIAKVCHSPQAAVVSRH